LFTTIKTKEQLAAALGVTFQKHLVYYLYRLPDEKNIDHLRSKNAAAASAPSTPLTMASRRFNENLRRFLRLSTDNEVVFTDLSRVEG
jgi:hypothetical protein